LQLEQTAKSGTTNGGSLDKKESYNLLTSSVRGTILGQ